MRSFPRSTAFLVTAFALLLAGCANPGPPKPPSLQIPAAVTDLKADRRGNIVELSFTLPPRTSDGLTLHPGQISARVCRAVETGVCKVVPGLAGIFMVPDTLKTSSVLRDALANDLIVGAPRLLTYRLELFNAAGRSAGYSSPAFAAAGEAPPAVEGLRADGSRLGVVLRWQPVQSQAEMLLVREDLKATLGKEKPVQAAAKSKADKVNFDGIKKEKVPPPVITLSANPEKDESAPQGEALSVTLDTNAISEEPYRYTAERKQTVDLNGHKLELWSLASAPVTFTLHDSFPPPAPTNLSVAGFMEPAVPGKAAAYGVDLIWEPVQDDQLAGYRVYRAELPASGNARGALLTSESSSMPAFHDATASGSKRYRYSVTSVDRKGNESGAVTAVLEPQLF